MGNDKSKRTGTLHLKTTPDPDKLTATTTSTTDSTAPVLEPGEAPPNEDAALNTDGANAAASEGAAVVEHVIEATGTLAANAPTSSTEDTGPASAVPVTSAAENQASQEPISDTQTKMEIATEIYIRMKKAKGMTRKEIIAAFVVDAKLSKAGASTYYQLIKAKIEEK
jgi:hypothetical protein